MAPLRVARYTYQPGLDDQVHGAVIESRALGFLDDGWMRDAQLLVRLVSI